MKPRIDFFATLKSEMLSKKSMTAKLKRTWGVSGTGDDEVFAKQLTVWPLTSERREVVSQALGVLGIKMSTIDEQSKDGITRLYLYFDKGKLSGNDALSREALATVVEREIPFEETRTLNYNFTTTTESAADFLDKTNEELLAYVKANYDINAVGLYGEIVGDSIPDDVFGKYVLLDDGTDFEVKVTDCNVRPFKVYSYNNFKRVTTYSLSVSVELEYKRIGYLNDDSPIIVAMVAENNADRLADLISAQNSTGYNDDGWIPSSSSLVNDTDAIWLNGQLRTSIGKNLRPADFSKVVFGSIKIGYDKKKTKWYKKALAIVIAIVVTVATWGALGPVMAISLGALTLSIGAMILASMGEYDGAEYVGRWAKVAGIVATIAGITAMLQNLATKAATTAAIQASPGFVGTVTGVSVGTTTTTVTTAVGQTLNISTSSYMSALTSEIFNSVGSMSVNNMLSAGMKVLEYVNGNIEKGRAAEIRNETEAVKESAEQVAEEYDKNIHIAAEHIKMYTKPLTMANAQFEVDYQYEGLGMNILRPTFARFGPNIQVKELPKLDGKLFESYQMVKV